MNTSNTALKTTLSRQQVRSVRGGIAVKSSVKAGGGLNFQKIELVAGGPGT
jgi:hypothetical protein